MYLPFPTIRGAIRAPKQPHIHPKNVFPMFLWLISSIPPKNYHSNHFFTSTYLRPIWDWRIYHSQPSGGPIRAPKWPNIHPKKYHLPYHLFSCSWYQVLYPQNDPLTFFWLQPITCLSEICISTIPDHQGPHQNPKMATHTQQKTTFSIPSFYSWLISGTPPQNEHLDHLLATTYLIPFRNRHI